MIAAALNLVPLTDDELAALRSIPELLKQLESRTPLNGDRLESPRETAKRLRINVGKVRSAISSGKLSAVRRPGRGGNLSAWVKPSDADRVLGVGSK